jgi:hypothetical protein
LPAVIRFSTVAGLFFQNSTTINGCGGGCGPSLPTARSLRLLLDGGNGYQNGSDYTGIIDFAKGSRKAKQLSAQLIPRYFKFFPAYSSQAINAQLDLCEEDELPVRCHLLQWLRVFVFYTKKEGATSCICKAENVN